MLQWTIMRKYCCSRGWGLHSDWARRPYVKDPELRAKLAKEMG